MNRPLKKSEKVMIGLVWVILGVGAWIAFKTPSSPPTSQKVAAEEQRHSEIEAYTQGQEILKKYLKAPSTAQFPTMSGADIKELQDDGWQISSYVDAQNSFGVPLRQNWQVVFQYAGDHVEVYVVALDNEVLFKRATTK